MYSGRYDSPVCRHLCGININQEDDPHWVVSVLAWLGMFRAVMESQWSKADGYRKILEQKLQTEPPSFLYEFYKNFVAFLETDMKR